MTQPIPIIGAGLAGLTLSRTLLYHNIPSILYEKATKKPRNNYAITLHKTAYQPLLRILGLDEVAFKRRVAVDAETGGLGKIEESGTGTIGNKGTHNGLYDTNCSFRANRARLEQVLQEGLEIRWESNLKSVGVAPQEGGVGGGGGTKLAFQNGETCSSKFVVGADGVHSDVRKLLLPSARTDILPYAVFNGKYKVDAHTYSRDYASAMSGSSIVEKKVNGTLLSVSVNEARKDVVYINWIYSRSALESEADPLFRPDRSLQEAQAIPSEFFDQVSALAEGKDKLELPFSTVFNTDRMRQDRILHWLMRTTSVSLSNLQTLSRDSGVCLVGDAIHAEPILGGNGANAAILDGVTLAEAIVARGSGVETWYKERDVVWKKGVEGSARAIGEMHQLEKQMSGNL